MSLVFEKCDKVQQTAIDLLSSIQFCEPTFNVAVVLVIFNPLFWNFVSRMEYYTHFLTKLMGSPRNGCYLLAMIIFGLGVVRSYFFDQAMQKQAASVLLDNNLAKSIGLILISVGQILVISSMYQLGITGTYCGDYFGILMKDRVTAFPFNIVHNPMYRGSTLSFLGCSLLYGKPAGLVITFFVHMIYEIALKFEEPFTMKIYKKDPRLSD